MDSRIMIVREEYRLAMKALEEAEVYRKGAAVLGQPGIGKTFFLIYALVEHLRKARPTAFQSHPQTYFLFTEKGVTTHSTDDAEPLKLWHGIWALSDSNLVTISPAVVFLEAPSICTIQATSPDAKRWKEWTKQYKAHRYIMDNWTSEELSALASVLPISNVCGISKSNGGPSPRQLLEIGNNEEMESTFQEDIDIAASYFISNVGQVVDSLRSLDFPLGKSGPSSLVFIKPKRDGPDQVLRMRCEAFVLTTRIEHSIAKALLKWDALTRSQFFRATSSYASMKSTAGYVFEQWVHACFLSRVKNCIPSSNSGSLLQTLVTAHPSQLISTDTEIKTQNPPFYWRPPSSNFPGVDELLRHGDDVYAIQCTISRRHGSLLEGLRKLQKIIGKNRGLSWRVLFVGSSESQATEVARPHLTLTESDSLGKRKRKTDTDTDTEEVKKYIPVGMCVLPIVSEYHTEEELDGLLEQLVCAR
ncbi:hypothetical protein BU15DRAFT_55981 [Melanogaster broomeanus]|nr:hypothetical protein BU15DRAFT_55981 [Melanogaster broomeanus]